MSNQSVSSSSSAGLGFTGALTITFIVLKLTGVITWSWWWVLSPIWISALLTVVILIVIVLIAVISVFVGDKRRERRLRRRR